MPACYGEPRASAGSAESVSPILSRRQDGIFLKLEFLAASAILPAPAPPVRTMGCEEQNSQLG